MKMKCFLTSFVVSLQAFALSDVIHPMEPPLPVVDTSNDWRPYMKAGVVLIFPTVGMGVQYRSGQNGFDLSVNGASIEKSGLFVSGKALYQYWSVSNPGAYCGIGAGGCHYRDGGWFKSGIILPSLEQVVGYEISNGKTHPFFIQLEFSELFYIRDPQFSPPIPSVSRGFRF